MIFGVKLIRISGKLDSTGFFDWKGGSRGLIAINPLRRADEIDAEASRAIHHAARPRYRALTSMLYIDRERLGRPVERSTKDWVQRAGRRRTTLTGFATRADGSRLRVLVSNISYEGCHVWSDGELQKGELIELCLAEMGLIRAQVRWLRGGSVGVKFVTGDCVADERRARLGV